MVPSKVEGFSWPPMDPMAPLTGVGGVVLGVLLQLVDVHLHAGARRALHHAVDVLPGQGQGQPLPAAAHRLVVQDGRYGRGTTREGSRGTWRVLVVVVTVLLGGGGGSG